MCGRVACSRQCVEAVYLMLQQQNQTHHQQHRHTHHQQPQKEHSFKNHDDDDDDDGENKFSEGGKLKFEQSIHNACTSACECTSTATPILDLEKEKEDNWNLSPGLKSTIFHCQNTSSTTNGSPTATSLITPNKVQEEDKVITCSTKTWGLVPKPGTQNHPLFNGPTQHFENLMFNARSDTLYEKNTFRKLALQKQSCIWAIDGFYEWKYLENHEIAIGDSDSSRKQRKTKQPYYVHGKENQPLLIPGLWTSVKTGIMNELGEPQTLDTFTLLTTDASQPLRWLHHRQPVIIRNENIKLALQWMQNPSKHLADEMSRISSQMTNDDNILGWHAVTKRMSNTRYTNIDSTYPIKIENVPSITSFFKRKAQSQNAIDKIDDDDHCNNGKVCDQLSDSRNYDRHRT
mmetsp:Transcript_24907/g.30614  ORF Transcript_24907/g.30614 Transcript_24907/m.30614 type:complete len:403 (+) Transcript_24907:150-1358(+)